MGAAMSSRRSSRAIWTTTSHEAITLTASTPTT